MSSSNDMVAWLMYIGAVLLPAGYGHLLQQRRLDRERLQELATQVKLLEQKKTEDPQVRAIVNEAVRPLSRELRDLRETSEEIKNGVHRVELLIAGNNIERKT